MLENSMEAFWAKAKKEALAEFILTHESGESLFMAGFDAAIKAHKKFMEEKSLSVAFHFAQQVPGKKDEH